MRVLLAASFVFACMLGTIGLLSSHYGNGPTPGWTKPLPPVVMMISLLLATLVFNRRGYGLNLRPKPLARLTADLEAQGLLVRQPFQAVRAFAVDEFEDEGPQYFIELVDGRVLYLNGQYLYDYEKITDDPQVSQPRLFPCTEFEILRHKVAGYVVHIQCAGTVLEPEFTAAPFAGDDSPYNVPEDGEIITDRSYEALKQERAIK